MTYYIVYLADQRIGACTATMKRKIRTYGDISATARTIETVCHAENVNLLSWTPIKL